MEIGETVFFFRQTKRSTAILAHPMRLSCTAIRTPQLCSNAPGEMLLHKLRTTSLRLASPMIVPPRG